MDEDEYVLQPFQIHEIGSGQIYVILGDNDQQANLITRDICQQLSSSIKFVNVFSATAKFNNHYKEYIPSSFVFHEFTKNSIVKLFKQQQSNMEKLRKLGNISDMEAAKDMFNTLIILDRINAKWLKDDDVNEFFGLARDMHITIIWRSVESSVPKNIAHKFDYCFVLTATSVKETSSIYRSFAGAIPTQKDFKMILSSNVTRDCSLVVDRRRHIRRMTADEDPDLIWIQGFAKYTPNLDIGPLARVGLAKLWLYTNEDTNEHREVHRGDIIDSPLHQKLDIQRILQTYGSNKKLRIQIIDQDDHNDHNDHDDHDDQEVIEKTMHPLTLDAKSPIMLQRFFNE